MICSPLPSTLATLRAKVFLNSGKAPLSLLNTISLTADSVDIEDRLKKLDQTNLKFEKDTIDNYMKTLAELNKEKLNLPYEFLKINFALERIVRKDQSHVSQLSKLLGEAI